MGVTLAELAKRCGAELRGDAAYVVEAVSTVESAGPGDVVFVTDEKHLDLLGASAAGAVILARHDAGRFSGNVLVSDNPRLCYARAAGMLHPLRKPLAGRHASAVVDPAAIVDPSASIGPYVVIEAGARIGREAIVGAGSFVGHDTVIGVGSWLHANVTVAHACVLGERCIVHPGAVIGSDGFGFARDGARWEKTVQLGRVLIGDDVEIGANTTIDRGALGDTVIERGVKLDNLIHVAHNVVIGEDTAIAACVGIAGSTRIGKRCTLAGQVGVVGHIEITDDVHVMGAAVVSHTIREPGTYAGSPLEPYQSWLRNAVRMRQLDDLARRLKKLEQLIATRSEGGKVE